MKTISHIFGGYALAVLLVACSGGGGGIESPEPSANATLSSMQLTGTALEQQFDPGQTEYSALVGYLTASIQIRANAAVVGATVIVNGEVVGPDGRTVALSEGHNRISVQVTAADGTTTRAYSVTVERQALSAFAQTAYIKAADKDRNGGFGEALAIHGDTLAVGVPYAKDPAAGAAGVRGGVYIFTRDADENWAQQAYIKAPSPDLSGQYGYSGSFGYIIALSGDTLAVGMQMDDGAAVDSGAVYLFTSDAAGTWSEQAYIKAPNADSGDWFGGAIALSGDTLAVGATREDGASTGIDGDQDNNAAESSGAVYVFERGGAGTWLQQAYIKASNTDANDVFGASVALHDNLLLVGATGEDSWATGVGGDQTNNSLASGAAYLFARDESGAWSQQEYVKASNPDLGDAFGARVSLADNIFAVAAPGEDSGATGVNGDQGSNEKDFSGAVYVFAQDADIGWSQEAYIKASNPDEDDLFGVSIALFGDSLVVGAPFETSYAKGIGGDQSDNRAFEAGAAYLFTRDSSGLWAQRLYIKGSNTSGEFGLTDEDGDRFGSAVAGFGDTFVIGGQDDSAATGVNGDQLNKDKAGSGAAYVFGGPPNRDALLSALNVGGFDLDQIFQPTQHTYSVGVGFLVTSLHLDIEAEEPGAAVFVNGVRVNYEGYELSLDEGSNAVEIEVVATDGTTISNYTLTINRQSASTFAQLAYVKASNPDSGDLFGRSVAIDGNILAVGAFREDSRSDLINGDQEDNTHIDKGAVYVFERNDGSAWAQTAYLKTGDAGPNARFGMSVAVSGRTIAVGAPEQGSSGWQGSGAVFVFEPNESGFWQQRAYLKASNADSAYFFGTSVSLSGDTLAVGTNGYWGAYSNHPGDVYVFVRRPSGSWEQQDHIKAHNPDLWDRFGASVSVSGDFLAIGAWFESSAASGIWGDGSDNSAYRSGAVYLFARERNGGWQLEAYIKASNTEARDWFGHAVALDGDTLAIGADGEDSAFSGVNTNQADNKATGSGAVYVFVREPPGIWSQQAYIKASNTDAWDRFGYSVALDGDTLVVGAPAEKSISTGINGDQFNDEAELSGAAYLYTRDATGKWSHHSYIKASNTGVRDNLGVSVALSDGVLVIGVPDEDSAAEGINGDQSDNSAVDAGAAYIFE